MVVNPAISLVAMERILVRLGDFCPTGLSIQSMVPEGPWCDVVRVLHDCHVAVHALGAPRIATDVRIGTRTDRETVPGTGNTSKVKRVEDILAKEKQTDGSS